MDKRNLLKGPQKGLDEFLTVGSSDDDDDDSTGSSPSVSGSAMMPLSFSGSAMMSPNVSGSAMMSPSFSGYTPSAAPDTDFTPIRPARLDLLSPPSSGSRPSPSSSRGIDFSSNGKNRVCKHLSSRGAPRQPASCMDCFDEHNTERIQNGLPVEQFGRICEHRKFMNASCIQCRRAPPRVIKKSASVVPVAAVASSYNPSLAYSNYDVAGPISNRFGQSVLAGILPGEEDDHLLPPRLDTYSEEEDDDMREGGGRKSYRKSARKLIKKAKRSSRKAKRSSRKAKRSSRKAKRSSKKAKRS